MSGCIYEKRLILKYLHDSPTDPVNGQPLTEDQLIDVKGMAEISERERHELSKNFTDEY